MVASHIKQIIIGHKIQHVQDQMEPILENTHKINNIRLVLYAAKNVKNIMSTTQWKDRRLSPNVNAKAGILKNI